MVAALTLALGIGANTSIFSLMREVLLKTLPVKDPEQLVLLSRDNLEDRGLTSFPYPLYRDFQEKNQVLSGLLCRSRISPSLGDGGPAERLSGELVSGNYFEVLGVGPYLGRLLSPEDDRVPGAHPVVVLSYDFWRRRFGSDSTLVGKTIHLNTNTMTVIGVTPRGFDGLDIGQPPDVWVPMMMQAEMTGRQSELDNRNDWWLQLLGRLSPGVSAQQAQAVLQLALLDYLKANNGTSSPSEYQKQLFASQRMLVLPAHRGLQTLGNSFRKPLLILMGVAGAVLLIMCVNLANLLLVRATGRRREIAIRLALGASQARLLRQLLTESVLLALFGGLLGIWLVQAGSNLLVALLNSVRVPIKLDLHPDPSLLGFALVLSVGTGVLFGLAPALQSIIPDFSLALKGEALLIGRNRFPVQKVFLIGQIALSLALLIATTLFVRTLHNLRVLDVGFRRENVLQVTLDPAQSGYTPVRIKAFYRQVLERVSALPGVSSASFALVALMDDSYWGSGISVEGYTIPEGDAGPLRNAVGPAFFKTTGIPLLLGREFTPQDNETAPKVAVVNEEFARFYFHDQNPLGKRIGTGQPDTEIVGVVRDGKHGTMREGPTRFWYVPYEQMGVQEMTLYVRTRQNSSQTIDAVRKKIADLDPSIALYNVRTCTGRRRFAERTSYRRALRFLQFARGAVGHHRTLRSSGP